MIGTNIAKQKLTKNELVLCFGVNQTRTPNIAMMAAACGFDALYIDLEHNPTSLETASAICVAAIGLGVTPIARRRALRARAFRATSSAEGRKALGVSRRKSG